MKKTIVKYFIEFIVIVIGVSISFYAENYNDSLNKIQLKNQSLNRILENLKVDNRDNRFNYKAHSESLISSEWILTNRNNLSAYSRDTIGFHLSRAINIITYFETIKRNTKLFKAQVILSTLKMKVSLKDYKGNMYNTNL